MIPYSHHLAFFLTMSRWVSFVGILMLLLICPRPASSQWQMHSLEHDGMARYYGVFLPQDFQPNMPMVVSVHGYSETFEWYRDYTVMHEHADTAGFVLVYPLGHGRAWNSGGVDTRTIYDVDDVGFISEIIDTVHANYNVDLQRVYCCGFSNGGEMTYRLACELGQRFAAVASVAGCLSDIADNAPWYPLRPMPVLHFHGTHDTFEYYDGNRPGFDLWSVARTLDFWVQRNNCPAAPETVWVPDIDTTDNSTVQKITYGNCSDSTQIIHYKIIDGGHTWPGSTFSYGAEGNKNNDISANVVMWDFFKEYSNPLGNMTFGKWVDVDPSYASPQVDSLYITGEIRNPVGHPVTVRAFIEGIETSYLDSLELFDDGQHGDVAPGDNLFGGEIAVSGLEEDFYKVVLMTYDGTLGKSYVLRKWATFTTAGPLVIDTASRGALPDTVFWCDAPLFWLNLRNLGSVRAARNVYMKLESDHSCVFPPASAAPFGDIQPKETGLDTPFKVWFHPTCTETLNARMVARIMSEGTNTGVTHSRLSLSQIRLVWMSRAESPTLTTCGKTTPTPSTPARRLSLLFLTPGIFHSESTTYWEKKWPRLLMVNNQLVPSKPHGTPQGCPAASTSTA